MQFQCDVESVWCVVTSIGSDRVQQFKFVIFALCFHASTDKWEENKQQNAIVFSLRTNYNIRIFSTRNWQHNWLRQAMNKSEN